VNGEASSGRGHLWVAVAALLFQALPPLAISGLALATYGPAPRLSEAAGASLALWVLGLSAAVSLALGSAGAYGLLVRSRRWVAAGLIATCCLPALLAGAVYLRALLVFLAAA
jgi:hypothetical protein